MLRYLKSLLRHKWYVFVAGWRIGHIGLLTLIFHDWSKFLPDEFIPYARHDFNSKEPDLKFDGAWLKHQNRNKHHWQYWFLIMDNDQDKAITMPWKYVREMVADWHGASRAYTGSWDISEWIGKNGPRFEGFMTGETIRRVHATMSAAGYKMGDLLWQFEPGDGWSWE